MKSTIKKHEIFVLLVVLIFMACSQKSKKDVPLYEKINADNSGLYFANNILESDSLNYLSFPYIYMGAGVAIADFDNDGLSDIYVTGNMVPNKLYHNKGNLVFNDISDSAGVAGDRRWYTGVAVVDINNDGFLDLYVSVSGKTHNASNQLFVNNGDLTFTERAKEYGIDDQSTSIQSSFFDYDQDGDLDLFVANYPLVPLSQGNGFYAYHMKENLWKNSGHLYRNEGGNFIDVTAEAGVQNFGLTLGISTTDLNNDGLTDIYVSNDFNVPDYLYLNLGDGRFKEIIKEATGQTSMFGMGIDAGDFDNDGWLDLVQADMTPEDYVRAKVNMASMNPDSFFEAVDLGFHYQYMQNSLQLNQGNVDGMPYFGNIAQKAGVATTDWSWSTLFLDMDNDGRQDIYVTNGMKRDVNDNDMNQRTGVTTFSAAFGKRDLNEYPSEPIENYAFRNLGDYQFEKSTVSWGLDYKGFSNGMSYGDLDNDGDLELVINNLDQTISLFNNKSQKGSLRIKLHGPKNNPLGIGAKVSLENKEVSHLQTQQLTLSRGFQSSIEPIVHFGMVNEGPHVLKIYWPDGKEQSKVIDSKTKKLEVYYDKAINPKTTPSKSMANTPQFKNFEELTELNYEHKEDKYDDYSKEPLLPHRYSRLGPALAVGDINSDGLSDFFVGNAAGSEGKLYQQDEEGAFFEVEGPWKDDDVFEDVGAFFFDVDGDGNQDLYVSSGGNHLPAQENEYRDRLYLNTENGFLPSRALPEIYLSSQVASPYDYDQDGDLDVFVGGRIQPGQYPSSPKSYLLENNGLQGEALEFSINHTALPNDGRLGMVTDASWVDVDGNGWKDLIVVGEWMPIRVFFNREGVLEEASEGWGLQNHTGWWYSVQNLDVDHDGDEDLIVGNLGLNYKYKASKEKPFEIFYNDFDENGKEDIVLGVHKEGKLLPLRGRECSSQQVPGIKHKYKTYREFAAADLPDIYGKQMLNNSLHLQANTFAHYWLENTGQNGFVWHLLPARSQLAPINDIIVYDWNGDTYPDLLVSGGLYDAEVETPRADFSVGLLLYNNMGKGFEAISPSNSGLYIKGDAKNTQLITIQRKTGIIYAINEGSLHGGFFEPVVEVE